MTLGEATVACSGCGAPLRFAIVAVGLPAAVRLSAHAIDSDHVCRTPAERVA